MEVSRLTLGHAATYNALVLVRVIDTAQEYHSSVEVFKAEIDNGISQQDGQPTEEQLTMDV